MYNVSNAYKAEVRSDVIEPQYIKVIFGIQDPQANQSAVINTTDGLVYSESPTLDDYDQIVRYGTLEDNQWLLNGHRLFQPNSGSYSYQGFIGNNISDIQSAYTTPSKLTITFSDGNQYAFRGLSLRFDIESGDAPKTITVVGSLGGVENYRKIIDVTSSEFSYEGNIPYSGNYVDTLQIILNDSNIPYRRPRVEQLVLGVIKNLTSDNIQSATWDRSNDLINSSIPSITFSFSFIDENNEYNPDNPEGLFGYLESGQKVQFKFGQTLEDGSIEWVNGGTTITDGAPEVNTASSLSIVNFTSTSKLETLTDSFSEFSYRSTGYTFYELAEMLCVKADLFEEDGTTPRYVIDSSLQNYSTLAPLPEGSIKELLQIVANAAMCIMQEDRDGILHIKPFDNTLQDFKFTPDMLKTSMPTAKKYPILHNVVSKLFAYTVSSESEELNHIDVSGVTDNTYELDYEDATNISAIVSDSNLVVVGTPVFYARKAIVTITGTGTLTITGNRITQNYVTVSKAYGTMGDDCPIENSLITSSSHLDAYMDWIAGITERRTQYTITDLGFPEIDVTDNVGLDSAFTEDLTGTVTKSTISYNGGFSGDTELIMTN